VVADPALSGEMVRRRGSLTFTRACDPDQAHGNRVRGDSTFGCECDCPGCMEQVAVPFGVPARPLLAHGGAISPNRLMA